MYPNENRYSDNINPMEGLNQSAYNNSQMRASSIDINNRPPQYYDPNFYGKNPIMQPTYDYMNPPTLTQPPPMIPMNQSIDPRYSTWRQSSEVRLPAMHGYDYRPPMNQPYMHSKNTMPSMHGMIYAENYSHDHLSNLRPGPMNILQRISLLIKPQLPELRRIMSKIATSTKKKQTSRRQKSKDRQRERQRSHQRHGKHSNSSEWVCGKCSFLNFDWRQKCKKCSQAKPNNSGKNYNPGPQDWKCVKCNNVNYARRLQCNRCKNLRSNNTYNR